MRETKYLKNNNKIKPVTAMPGWMLKVKGWIDSYLGESVCDKYVEGLHKKMACQAGNEDIAAENDLFLLRKEAAFLILEFREQEKRMSAIPSAKAGDSTEVVRENRRNNAAFQTARTDMQELVRKMTELDETISHIETVRNIRISKMQSYKEEKIAAYVAGVRCGALKQYEPAISAYDDSARHVYREKHEALEEQMKFILTYKEA